MPLHRIYHSPGAFSDEDKQEMAKRITAIYVKAGLPYFYVYVLFVPLEEKDFFVGGKPNAGGKFVRITIDHGARSFAFNLQAVRFFAAYEAAIAPFIKDRGLDWELSITEVDTNLWRENGLIPPLPGSEAEKMWVRLDKPVPFTDEQNQ